MEHKVCFKEKKKRKRLRRRKAYPPDWSFTTTKKSAESDSRALSHF